MRELSFNNILILFKASTIPLRAPIHHCLMPKRKKRWTWKKTISRDNSRHIRIRNTSFDVTHKRGDRKSFFLLHVSQKEH